MCVLLVARRLMCVASIDVDVDVDVSVVAFVGVVRAVAATDANQMLIGF